MVATSEGWFYVYGIDLEKGGEGTLVKQYSLIQNEGETEAEGGNGGD